MMGKVIWIEVPDWIDEKSIKDMVRAYVRSKLPDSVTREEYTKYMGIDVKDIVEHPPEKELKILDEMRKKSEKRCRY